MTLNVLHIIPSLAIGGAENVLKKIIKHHAYQYTCTHTVVCLISYGSIGHELKSMGVEVIKLDLSSMMSIPKVLIRLHHIIKGKKPDVIQTWMYHANLFGGISAKLAGHKKIVWGIRTTDAIGKRSSRSSRIVRKLNVWFSYWIPTKIICVAEAAKKSHVEAGYNKKIICVIPNGFKTSIFSPLAPSERLYNRISCNIYEKHLVLGSLGRFSIEKDHYNFIKACGIILQQYDLVRILMVGRELNAENKVLMKWIVETGYPEKFILLGEKNNVVPYLSVMDIFCLHSLNEGFPNVVGEAMAMSLPCVATDVGDAKYIVGNTGWIVPSRDSELLAVALKQSLVEIQEAPDEWNKRKNLARNRIKEEYSINKMVDSFQSAWKKCENLM